MFKKQAGEQPNSDDGFSKAQGEDEAENRSNESKPGKQGAAVWADIHIPVVRPDGWPVHHLQMGLRALERLRRETEAAMALLTGAMPESRDTVADIARNSGVSNREARRRKAVADVCGKVKGALEKLQSGEVSNEHVSALAPVADMPGAASLLDDAASKSPEELTRDVEDFRLSSACGENMAKRQRARRYLRFFAGPDGTIGINGLFPPIEGTELKNRLAAIVDAQWRKDHPDRARTLGGHNDDTHDQRMADALLSMAGIRAQTSHDSSPSNPETTADEATASKISTDKTTTGEGNVDETGVDGGTTTGKANVDEGVGKDRRDPKPANTPHAPVRFPQTHDQSIVETEESQSSASSSSPSNVQPEAQLTPPETNIPRPYRPEAAMPMKVGLRLVGLPSPPAMRAPGRSISSTKNGAEPSRSGTETGPPNELTQNDKKSFGTTVKTGKPAVVIVFDVDRWKARIAGGSPIPITESLLDQARNDLYYCFKNTPGEVIKFARSRRDPTPVQRLVLVVRDEKCLYPGCHAPPDACDAHHLNEVVKDKGRTDTDVMGLFCEAHHRHIHLNDLVVKRNPDGSITISERRTGAVVASTQPTKRAA